MIFGFIRYIKRYFVRWVKNTYSMIYFNSKGCIMGRPKHVQGIKNICIGKKTTIDIGCRLDCYKIGDAKPYIKIGKNCLIGFDCSFLAASNLIIGDNNLFASHVFISTENHGMNPDKGCYMTQTLTTEDVIIENNCWIGENVSILPGVTIGEWSVIGANSVVTHDISKYSMAVGAPARVIKRYNQISKKWEPVENGGEEVIKN